MNAPRVLEYCRLAGVEKVRGGCMRPDTLLGPEGSGDRPSGRSFFARKADARPKFENYTVDASIFNNLVIIKNLVSVASY
jgi:hypothetical protein